MRNTKWPFLRNRKHSTCTTLWNKISTGKFVVNIYIYIGSKQFQKSKILFAFKYNYRDLNVILHNFWLCFSFAQFKLLQNGGRLLQGTPRGSGQNAGKWELENVAQNINSLKWSDYSINDDHKNLLDKEPYWYFKTVLEATPFEVM